MAHDLSLEAVSQPGHENVTLYSTLLARRVLTGSFFGMAWGASLRAWMTILALEFGENPQFTWAGTFGAILLPATLVGALLGAAAYEAESSDRKRWRWAVLSPLLLIVAPVIVTKDFFTTLITTGLGGGAIGVALIGVFGGYALSGFGARWTRWVSGLLAASIPIAYFATSVATAAPNAGRVFSALLSLLLMVLLVLGVSAPSRMARS